MKFINKAIFPTQIHYFFLFSGIGPLAIFCATIAKQVGLSANAFGLVFFCVPILSIFGRIICGAIADKFHAIKPILVICLLLSAIFALATAFLPKLERDLTKVSLSCQQNGTTVEWLDHLDDHEDAANLKGYKNCQLLHQSFKNFFDICSDWKANEDSSDFDCEKVVIEVKFLSSTKEFTDNRGVIEKATSGKLEIWSPYCQQKEETEGSVDCSEPANSFLSEILTAPFWLLFIAINGSALGYYVAAPISDAISFSKIKNEPHLYGKIRAFGSASCGLSSALCGLLIDFFSNPDSIEKNYLPMCTFVALFFVVDALWILKALKDDFSSKFNFRKVSKLFLEFDTCVFVCWTFFMGFYQQLMWQFGFWYVEEISNEDDVSWFKTLQGLYELCNTFVGDAVAFYTSGWLIRKFGIKNCMSFTFVLSAIRFFGFSILSRPIWVLPISSIDGWNYGLEYALITSYSDSIAAPGTANTVQATFNCIFDGVGTSVGALFAGFVYSYFGGAMAFRIYAYSSLGTCFIHILARYLSTRIQTTPRSNE